MHVTEVGPAFAFLDDRVVHVEITVFLLGGADHLDQFSDGVVNFHVVFGGEEVAGSLDLLGYVRVPEEVLGHGLEAVVVVDGVPLELEAVISARFPEVV